VREEFKTKGIAPLVSALADVARPGANPD
jgi:hypothetical protein